MTTTSIEIDFDSLQNFPKGRVDFARLDSTTEKDIQQQMYEDDSTARMTSAQYTQSVRKRLGLSQFEFSRRIEVSLNTIRNWEQGKREPTGAAKALLKILNKNPELALASLSD